MSFEFVSDRPVLDFLATIAERGTTDEEKLAAPADLVAWAAESGLASDVPAPTAAQLAAAIALREAMYRLLGASLDGTAPARPDRERVNAAARRPPLAPQLSATGELTRTGTVDALLATPRATARVARERRPRSPPPLRGSPAARGCSSTAHAAAAAAGAT